MGNVRGVRRLCESAVEAALAAGASYADARVVVRRGQTVTTKNRAVEGISDVETEGIGVRVLVDGAWGFACDRRLEPDGAREAALRACRLRSRRSERQRTDARSGDAGGGERTGPPPELDPFEVPLEDKVALCLAAEEALVRPQIRVTHAFVRALRERRVLLTSDGTAVEHDHAECGGGIDAIAIRDGIVQVRSYPERPRRA